MIRDISSLTSFSGASFVFFLSFFFFFLLALAEDLLRVLLVFDQRLGGDRLKIKEESVLEDYIKYPEEVYIKTSFPARPRSFSVPFPFLRMKKGVIRSTEIYILTSFLTREIQSSPKPQTAALKS